MTRSAFKQTSCTPIGLDFDYNEFRAVQFDSLNDDAPSAMLTIPRQGQRTLVPSVDELQTLAASLYQRGFQSNKLALAVPKETSSFQIIELPPAKSGAPIHQLALLEAQRAELEALERKLEKLHGKTKDAQGGTWMR